VVRRHLASLWSLPDGTTCDLILLTTTEAGAIEPSTWRVEIARGPVPLYADSFATAAAAYTTAKRWLKSSDELPTVRTA
jgi:hypothetical protein